MALTLARQVTGRFKTISFWDSFHGAGFGAAGIGGEEHFHGGLGPMLPGAFHVEFPNYYRNPWGFTREEDVDAECLRQIEHVLKREPEMSAVIGEPISASPVIPSKHYWEGVRSLCDRHGALLIFDEIPHALGRTGRMFTFENFGIVPDMVVIGKGLGGGVLPLAAVIAREDLDVAADRALGHYTHEKNPVRCAAALATIDYIEKHALVAHARELGRYTLERLNEMKARHPLIGDARGIGLFLGIELVKDRRTRERASDEAEAVMYAALSRGLSFKTTMGNILTLTPALTICREEMDRALDILDQAIGEVERR
jgi:4-aminobutyrate aminotransferase